jgi:hypothetical protein
MIHSAPNYQKAREIGSKYAEFQVLAGAAGKARYEDVEVNFDGTTFKARRAY